MSGIPLLELFGYLASALIVISLMMTSVLRLRVMNLIGALAFTIYAVLIEAWPVVAVNGSIVIINVVFLHGLLRRRDTFSVLEVDADSAYLRRFLEFRNDDIRRFIPDFEYRPSEDQLRLFVLRDMVPAGLLIGRVRGRTLEVELDYATPGYRDLKIGRYLFGPGLEFFSQRGIGRFVSAPGVPQHTRYLARVGYEPSPDGWVRELT